MDDARKCSQCGQESDEASWRLAGALAYVDHGACIYCLCKRGVTPGELHRAAELGRNAAIQSPRAIALDVR
jgi:hypothetical protein